jgi:hypothetical protein
MGAIRIAQRIFIEKPEGKRPLERPKLRLVDNNKMDLGDIVWGGTDCIGLAQYRDQWMVPVNTVINLRFQ